MKSQDDSGVATLDGMSLEAREKIVLEKADYTTRKLEETCTNMRKSSSSENGVLTDLIEAIKWW